MLVIVSSVCFVGVVFAQEQGTLNVGKPLSEYKGTFEGYAGDETRDLEAPQIISNVILIFFSVIGVLFLVIIVYNGVKWTTGGGNPETIKKARAGISRAVIGMLIALSAYAITDFVIGRLLYMDDIDSQVRQYQEDSAEYKALQEKRKTQGAGVWDTWFGGGVKDTSSNEVDNFRDRDWLPDQDESSLGTEKGWDDFMEGLTN